MTRTANHLAITTSGTVHAAADLTVAGRPMHVLACNGRAVQAGGWPLRQTAIDCKACLAGIDKGRIALVGA